MPDYKEHSMPYTTEEFLKAEETSIDSKGGSL